MEMDSAMHYSDFDDEERVKSLYLPEVEAALLKKLDAKHVHVMDFAVSPWKVSPNLHFLRGKWSGPATAFSVSNINWERVWGAPASCIGIYWSVIRIFREISHNMSLRFHSQRRRASHRSDVRGASSWSAKRPLANYKVSNETFSSSFIHAWKNTW